MPYTDQQIDELLSQYPDWAYDPERKQVITGFQFADFTEAMTFANAIGEIANRINHHPNILIHDFNSVQIATTTHDEGGLTERDAQLISEIETAIQASQRPVVAPEPEAPVRQMTPISTPGSQAQPPLPQTATPVPQPAPVSQPVPPQPSTPILPGSQAVGPQGNLAGPSAANIAEGSAPVANG